MADDAGLKECRVCHEKKPAEEFGVRTRSVRRKECKSCLAEYKKSWLDRPGNRQRHNAISANARTKRLFGMTLEEYEGFRKSQGGVCAICKSAPEEGLGVDHNHKTGQVRGLLCLACNSGLGMFRDSPDLLHRAIFYLTER